MDAKDLRTESALSERNNDGSKYSQSGGIGLHCDRNKSYQDIGSNSLAKVDVQTARPCAVIGPDRIVPPPAPSEAYLKKGPIEPWPCMDNAYHTRRPPEYPHKLANFQNPTRNISPRQTFQENMQRIMVPPSYNSVKISDDTNYVQMSDRSTLQKNIKINMPPEAKFCDVPYTVYPTTNEQKNVRNPEMCISSVNPTLTRTAPHGWPSGSVNIRPTRTYGAPELYQYQDYPSCAGPRPVVPRPNRTVQEEGYVYADPFYHQEGNIRFKPYPTVKDRFPQQRYEYIGNYANSFHPPTAFPSHKYDLQKSVPPHPYPPYPSIKYLDRVPEPVMEGYQRNQQGSYNIPYRNQIIHPNYGQVLGNCPQNKIHSYPPDAHIKTVAPNKLPFDNAKTYIEYENGRPKMYPPSESYLVNEMGRMHPMKSQVIMSNYPTLNMHNMPPNPYYKKDNQQNMKNYEYLQAHFRSMDPNLNIHNPMIRHQPVFSPNTSAISPTDSSASNDTSQTLGTSQEDCGYVSQSSTASVRSMDSGINRIPNDCLRKYYDSRFCPIIRTAPMMSKSEFNSSNNSKEKRNIDVRQFFQMWNEGDEETEENNAKEVIIQAGPKCDNNFSKVHEGISQSNQEQLYVLGLVNVPSEELGKYEHIQKVSKLPENIKGYNHIELLNQFEEAIESSNMTNYKTSAPKDFQMPSKVVPSKQATCVVQPRPLSPLDVEAKISQSVIHKEVGCNFEIKPCSPKMMNVEVATPVQNILAERAIEKVANPVMLKSPRLNGIDENIDCNIMKRKDHRMNISNESVRIPSCKMANTQYSNNNSIDSIKNSYSLQDLESNSGLCLASLPRLDNDIELNFPEVNQQFINANKGDSLVSTSLRDLPSLELLEHSDNPSKDKLDDINSVTQANDVLKSPCIVDSEKEFSKLSKYRKTKPHLLDPKDNQTHHVINAARTDSVIIKNPENSKNHGEKSVFSPTCSSKQDIDIQQVPINLTSQGCIIESIENSSTIIETHNASKQKDTSVEIAIDFSLNKNTSDEKMDCIEVKNYEETEILTHNTIEGNHSTLEDHLTKLSTFSDCDQSNQHNFIDNNKLEEASIPTPIKCNDLETIRQTINDENPRSVQSPLRVEILTTKECSSPVSTGKEAKEVHNSTQSDVDEMNYVSSNSLLPIEFGSPAAELLPTADSDSYLMDIDKDNDIVDQHSDKASYSLIQKDTNDDNDLNNHNNMNLKDVRIDSVSNPQEVNLYSKGSSEDAEAKPLTNSKLNIDVPKDDLNQITNFTLAKDPCKINFDLPDNDMLDHDTYQSDSDGEETSTNVNLSSPNNIVIHNPNYQKERTVREIEFSLPSPNNIVTRSQDDYRKETINREIEFNLPSPNSIVTRSPDDNRKETVEHENDFNLPSPNNIVTRSPDDLRKNTTDRDNDFNLPSPNNIVTRNTIRENEFNLSSPKNIGIHSLNESKDDCQSGNNNRENEISITSPNNIEAHSPNDYHCKNTERETDSDFNSPSPNNLVTHSSNCQPEIVQGETDSPSELPSLNDFETRFDPSETDEQETDFNLPPPTNMVTPNSKNCQTGATEQENDSDFDLPVANNIPAHNSIDEIPNGEIDSNSEQISTNDVMAHKTNDVINNKNPTDLSTAVLDNQIYLSSSEDERCEDIALLNVEEKKLEITRALHVTSESVKEKEESNNLEIRYLSYGSKEMYSPWIQKLVMFCEGSTNNVNMNKNAVEGNNCAIKKTEIEHIEISYDLDHCLEDEIENVSNQEINSNNDCTIPADEGEAITSGDVSAMQEYSKIDHDNIYNEKCKNTEEEFDNVIEPAKLHNTSPLQENDKLNLPAVCSHNAMDIKNKIDETPTMSSIVYDIGTSCGKLEKLNVKGATCCLSPKVHEQWDEQSNCNDEAYKQWNKPSNNYDEVPNQLGTQPNCSDEVPEESNCIDEIPELWDKQSKYVEVPERWNKQSNCNDEITEQWDKKSNCSVPYERSKQPTCKSEDPNQWDGQSICDDEVPKQLDDQSTCNNNELPKQWDKQLNCNVEDFEQWDKQSDCNDQIPEPWDKQSDCNVEMPEQSNVPPNCKYIEAESTTIADNDGDRKIQSNEYTNITKKRLPLKRSLSDSALNIYNNCENSQQENEENIPFIWPFKRRKINNIQNDILAQNLCNIIQHNRRNSISAIYNEENVSFCILIDNGCIIAEEDNEDQEKICYTELSEECLAEIQNDCTKDEEAMAEVVSTQQQDNGREYSDSFIMQGEDEKVDESWVEDVACVETVISDDIAEDIEISGPSSPKDDVLSDNDESGVFSSSEHTDKVKYIYGDKMCNDDAQFVETLYNTPQMNVNKTLGQRETLISGEYYDNDSLERILSESNDQELSPYVPEYTEPVFSPGIIDVKGTVENKENMNKDISCPLQSDTNPLDVVVDTGINKIDEGNMKLIPFDETQDDTIHSCESSIDNVFTYKENDENTNYTTSSSPEVSSTTSEEKNSSILLKITNYKGSRISQINDINRDSKRPSCKFTEDKDYVQSHSNFPTHRPLLTKAAQKYIPPLKESMRDLKVKLSLPQHSLMKLKQLKISKDEPKVGKQNIPVPRVSKKPKPKFEDVLKSIDEIQIKMHKEKSKKSKKCIPKVVIKKNENGSHYASTSNKDEFNPDLTGRKWQPWVFIEKNHFIDKMAMKKKTKAIYNHRKRTYVLAEKFQKYKSVNSAKFVISPPISDCPSTGLKYTIRLKHDY